MDEIRRKSSARYQIALDSLLGRCDNLDRLLTESFEENVTLSTISKKSKITIQTLINAEPNEELSKLVEIVQDELDWAISALWNIERHLQLQIPQREDGNNFGVDVLEGCIKVLQDRSNLLAGYQLDLPTFYLGRAQIYEKIGKMETNVISTKTKESHDKKEIIELEEKRDTTLRVIEDYRRYLISYDTKWHWTLRDILRQAQDSYLIIYDTMEKNKIKLEKPKGSSTHHHMY